MSFSGTQYNYFNSSFLDYVTCERIFYWCFSSNTPFVKKAVNIFYAVVLFFLCDKTLVNILLFFLLCVPAEEFFMRSHRDFVLQNSFFRISPSTPGPKSHEISLMILHQIFWRSTSEGASLSRLRSFEDLNKIFLKILGWSSIKILLRSLADLKKI